MVMKVKCSETGVWLTSDLKSAFNVFTDKIEQCNEGFAFHCGVLPLCHKVKGV